MEKISIMPRNTKLAGPYTPAIEASGLIFFSGQIPVDFSSGKLIEGDIKEQTEQCLKNLDLLIAAAEIKRSDIVKVTIFVTDMKDYSIVNEIYSKFFTEPYPARTAIEVAALPLGANVEIEAIGAK